MRGGDQGANVAYEHSGDLPELPEGRCMGNVI